MTDTAKAVKLAQRARSVDPLSIDPLLAAADAEIFAGADAKSRKQRADEKRAFAVALGYLKKATEIQPRNSEAWFELGLFDLLDRGCPRAALPAFSRFTVLNGQDPRNVYYAQTLAKVNSGKPIC